MSDALGVEQSTSPEGSPPPSAASAVDAGRLENLISELASFGARGDGGVDRQALTADDFRARRFLIDLARSYGAAAFRDPIGNLFFRREGTSSGAAPVVTGSHADTQPTGGKLDGAYGVCAGVEVLAALAEADVEHRRPIEVVVWTNEEGCRFAPGSMGASAFTQPELLSGFLATADASGRTVAAELEAADALFADVPMRPLGTPMHAFVEAHIEQGPILADSGVPVGIVRGIQGTRWYEITVEGIASHAGSTPRANRRDAFRVATGISSEIYRMFYAGDERLRMTIGRVEVAPGSVNVIPERVLMTLDVRHPDEEMLDDIEQQLHRLLDTQPSSATVRKVMSMTPTHFDPTVQEAIAHASGELRVPTARLDSGAFHDSLRLARHCPTGMLFVPSVGGLSHNPAEHTDPADLVCGARVLGGALVKLANT